MTPDAEAKAVASDRVNFPNLVENGHRRRVVPSHRDAELSAAVNVNPPLSVPVHFLQREILELWSQAAL